MATTNANFQLLCRNPENPTGRWCSLTFTHPLPSEVCVEPTKEIEGQLKAVLIPIFRSHNPEVLRVSQKNCVYCTSPASAVNYTPVSYLHTTDPHIGALATVVCSSVKCQTEVHNDTQHIARRVNSGEDIINFEKGPKIRCCGCFEIKSNLKHCGGCRKVVYCGEACQRKDWGRHRPACTVAPGICNFA